MMRVVFIGLGIMGTPMAGHLIKAGRTDDRGGGRSIALRSSRRC
ncbi:NAD(P)-dependent oxidoreductase [Bradyrhizobium zhanjiangense]|uniref:NAD(P)-dependent oxidoreductase n=1 Tax=Bradyrhizobium zhanjiangense TaxID=1325107 RepID=A0ABY0DAB7_9BRAD|nr:NAD(P)-dependent oxidoreductase [Bradyrhizobium zhanjiangense]